MHDSTTDLVVIGAGPIGLELAVSLTATQGAMFTNILAGIFLLISMFFVHKSFYGMRIETTK